MNAHYNYFRDYSPETGRYIESDPIGLEGGLNTFGYVEATPLTKSDPEGKQAYGPFGFDPSAGSVSSGESLMAAQGSLGLGVSSTDICVQNCLAWKTINLLLVDPVDISLRLYLGKQAISGNVKKAFYAQAARKRWGKFNNRFLLPIQLTRALFECRQECECQRWKPTPYKTQSFSIR